MAKTARRASAVASYAVASDSDDDDGPRAAKSTKQKKKPKIEDSDSDDWAPEKKGDDAEEEEEEDDDMDADEQVVSDEEEEEKASVVASDDEASDILSEEDIKPKKNAFDIMKKAARKPAAKKKVEGELTGKALDDHLPPISTLQAMFEDMITKVDLEETVAHTKQRGLRVGTMCSGTESPVLALGLAADALKLTTGQDLKISHMFSCEIEPFKQGYIERNFHGTTLFRDVLEMENDEAHTAYGGLQPVNGDIDILIAGTSCVDYSPLNTAKKKIDAKGESGMTFFGMLSFVERWTPKIVILENVSSAPWEQVVEEFEKIGYAADFLRVDTKQYYLPHTRMRGYLIASPRKYSKAVSGWQEKLKSLSRPASVPLETFLRPDDDPLISRAREDFATILISADGTRRAPTDWGKCESRHARARMEENLGIKRPLTAWQDGGGPPTIIDGFWNDWCIAQTERVQDLMDISVLRMGLANTDINYKSSIWNLSQNVDRTTSSALYGISPCLTPNGIPYLTNRGGPLIGRECLALQGIPVDTLLLTRETEANLADLAGNAMSSTVVGAAMLAALHVMGKHLDEAPEPEKSEDVVMIEEAKENEERVRGLDKLSPKKVDLNVTAPFSTSILDLAQRSARKCACEGRSGMAATPIWKCVDCEYSACEDCKARPDHNYVLDTAERLSVHDFESKLMEVLPMRIKLTGFDRASIEEQFKASKESSSASHEGLLNKYIESIVSKVDGQEFHFQKLIRRSVWSATFVSADASLSLYLDPKALQWRLTVIPDKKLPANNVLRRTLEQPVARLDLALDTKSLTEGSWKLHFPLENRETTLTMEAVGDLVPSWRADLGLTEFATERRPGQIKITVAAEDEHLFERSVAGTYALKRQCGTASGALHRLNNDDDSAKPLYFFFDPTRSGQADKDSFVFAEECGRLDADTIRPVIITFKPKWRPDEITEDASQISAVVPYKWTPLPSAKLHLDSTIIEVALPEAQLQLSADHSACSWAQNVFSASVRFSPHGVRASHWARSEWTEVDLLHEGPEIFGNLSWILARAAAVGCLSEYTPLDLESIDNCSRCCPAPPKVSWYKNGNSTVSAIAKENGIEAAQYERSMKNRPTAVLVHTRQAGDNFEFKIGLNVASLAHRALAALPSILNRDFQSKAPTVAWRLTSADGISLSLGVDKARPTFSLPSNRGDPQAAQPPNFKKFQLRPEQLRSLTWMIRQETTTVPWVEEEVDEAILPQMGWHVEAKAEREVVVPGGVLADEVGYGKTAVTLALIDTRAEDYEVPKDSDLIAIKATLIIVPAHLSKQWPDEIKKFTGKAFEVIVIQSMTDYKKYTVADFQNADVVILSQTVLKAATYWPQLGDFAGSPRRIQFSGKANRYFKHCVDLSINRLPEQLACLRDPEQGPRALFKNIKKARKDRDVTNKFEEESERRLKGKAYADYISRREKQTEPEEEEKKPKQGKKVKDETVTESELDPWKLSSIDDWTETRCPPLSIFAFQRLVVDEFTYLEDVDIVAMRTIRAAHRWILSATPLLGCFNDIKSIANLLQVHLGVEEATDVKMTASASKVGRPSSEKTRAEEFHSFRDVHTLKWYRRRDGVAQKFLDQFVRQNEPEIDEIVSRELFTPVALPAAEMAIYLELQHHLLNIDARLVRSARVDKKKEGDRDTRLANSLGSSRSPEEALLKRSCHFQMDMQIVNDETAPSTCTQILNTREAQLEQHRESMLKTLKIAAAMHVHLNKERYYEVDDDQHFRDFLKEVFNDGMIDDLDAANAIRELAVAAHCTPDGKVTEVDKAIDKKEKFMSEIKKPRPAKSKAEEESKKREEDTKAKIWILREVVNRLKRMRKEYIQRVRSKRYFKVVRDVQQGVIPDSHTLALLSSCGHCDLIATVEEAAFENHCMADGCRAAVQRNNVVRATTLGIESTGFTFGAKLEKLIDMIDAIPSEERILVFVQFEDLFNTVLRALTCYDIPTAALTGTATMKSNTLAAFQDPKSEGQRVLLLQVADASASGANLTVANHVFFIAPLLTDTTPEYKATETQAIGRVRRYGQVKEVHVYRLFAEATSDYPIFLNRSGKSIEAVVAEQRAANIDTATMFPRTTRQVDHGLWSGAVDGTKKRATGKAKSKGKGKAKVSDSDESDAMDTEDDEPKPKKRAPVKRVNKKKKEASDDEMDGSSDEDKAPAPKKRAPAKNKAPKKKVTIPDESADEEEAETSKAVPAKRASPEPALETASTSSVKKAKIDSAPIESSEAHAKVIAKKPVAKAKKEKENTPKPKGNGTLFGWLKSSVTQKNDESNDEPIKSKATADSNSSPKRRSQVFEGVVVETSKRTPTGTPRKADSSEGSTPMETDE